MACFGRGGRGGGGGEIGVAAALLNLAAITLTPGDALVFTIEFVFPDTIRSDGSSFLPRVVVEEEMEEEMALARGDSGDFIALVTGSTTAFMRGDAEDALLNLAAIVLTPGDEVAVLVGSERTGEDSEPWLKFATRAPTRAEMGDLSVPGDGCASD